MTRPAPEAEPRAGRASLATGRCGLVPGTAIVLLIAGGLLSSAPAAADPRYHVDLGWQTEQISRALALEMGFGLRRRPAGRVQIRDGRRCLVATLLGFDVADEFAFDIDERVVLELELLAGAARSLHVAYDRSGLAEASSRHRIEPSTDGRSSLLRVTLERARFANRGDFGIDLAIAAPRRAGPLAICSLRLERSHETPAAAGFGSLDLRLLDAATGEPTPARVGLYDASGRAPLPSEDALPVTYFSEQVRHIQVRRRAFWPVGNRYAFYVDGSYRARLPAGRWELVVTKGPEYRVARRTFAIGPGKTLSVRVALERWVDLSARGWYGGDPHLHIERDEAANGRLLAMAAAEDLHLTGLLQFGDLRGVHARQYAWGERGHYRRDRRALISGQEDPRTAHRGHTMALDARRPVRSAARYFLYHEVLQALRRQGGVTGYAHLASGNFQARRGLALDVPFGLVDFVEILQLGRLGVESWYDFLSLGFRLAPAAGSDYPYSDLPGTVRNYVPLEAGFSPRAWLEGLAAGRTFVTNGPILELEANGRGIGSDLRVPPGALIQMRAQASLNPDLGPLDRLELVVNGAVVQRVDRRTGGGRTLQLVHSLSAERSFWVAARTRGADRSGADPALAHTAPIWVRVAGQRCCRVAGTERIVAGLRRELGEILADRLDFRPLSEPGETRALLQGEWPRQRELLRERVEQADEIYALLLQELRMDSGDRIEASRP